MIQSGANFKGRKQYAGQRHPGERVLAHTINCRKLEKIIQYVGNGVKVLFRE
jgi:hypothetical protein